MSGIQATTQPCLDPSIVLHYISSHELLLYYKFCYRAYYVERGDEETYPSFQNIYLAPCSRLASDLLNLPVSGRVTAVR